MRAAPASVRDGIALARLLGGQPAATAVRDSAPRRCAGRGGMNESKRSAPSSARRETPRRPCGAQAFERGESAR